MYLYNVGLKMVMLSFRMVWTYMPVQKYLQAKHPKAYKLIMGQRHLIDTIRAEMAGNQKEVYWFHAASLGEYNVIRPVIRQLKDDMRCIVVTFFSSTGYDFLTEENRKTREADHVFYLPLDTQENAYTFIGILRPVKAVFSISEYWLNYHTALKSGNIPTHIVSMLVGSDSYLLKWYGWPVRNALTSVRTFLVQDEISKSNLAQIGFNNVVVTGDPLFDNALVVSREAYHNDIIERFCATSKEVFVAGSVSDRKDLKLVSYLANANPDVKFIVVPHEISEEGLNEIKYQMTWKTLLYSECDANTDFADTHVLVIDFLGALAHIYRYGSWAYVGGGFTPYLHSVIEPVVYGVPVAFGPRIERKQTPKQMIKLGIGRVVNTNSEIRSWFMEMRDGSRLAEVRKVASRYAVDSSNVTDRVIRTILE